MRRQFYFCPLIYSGGNGEVVNSVIEDETGDNRKQDFNNVDDAHQLKKKEIVTVLIRTK